MISVEELASEPVDRIFSWLPSPAAAEGVRDILRIEVMVALGRLSVELANAQSAEAGAVAERMRAMAAKQHEDFRKMDAEVAVARGVVLASHRPPSAVA